MHRMMPAPFNTSPRLPTLAPAAWNSASEIDAFSPAPVSTATSAPSAMNFFTVSGIAAQRVSPGASFRTAIFMRCDGLFVQDQQDDEGDDEHRQRTPLQDPREVRVITDMRRNVLSRWTREQGFFFGHRSSLRTSVGGVHNKGRDTPQVLTLACRCP